MLKKTVSILAPAALLTLFGAGCLPAASPSSAPSTSPPESLEHEAPDSLDSVEVTENSYRSREQIDEAFACEFDETVPIASAEGYQETIDALNEKIQLATGERSSATSSPRTLEDLSRDFIEPCREERLGEDPGLRTEGVDQFFHQGFEVQLNQKGILSIEFVFQEYTGGVHPFSGAKGLSLDLQTGNELRLENEINSAQQKAFYLQVRKQQLDEWNDAIFPDQAEQFRNEVNGLSPVTGEALQTFFEKQAFYLNEDGLVIFDDPYLIAPYAAGRIHTLIPYENLKRYLKTDSPLRRLTP